MKKYCILIFVSIFLTVCYAHSVKRENNFASKLDKKDILLRLTITSNYLADSVENMVRTEFKNKKIHIISEEEYKRLADEHYNNAYKFARKDDKSMPDPNRLKDALKTLDSRINCLFIYYTLQRKDGLILEEVEYSYGKYPVTGNLKKIKLDIAAYPDKSIIPVTDSLIDKYTRYLNKK